MDKWLEHPASASPGGSSKNTLILTFTVQLYEKYFVTSIITPTVTSIIVMMGGVHLTKQVGNH